MVYSEGRGSKGTTTTAAGGMSYGKSDKLKVAYTNVDGLLSSMLEIKDYSSSKKSDVFCMTETKLKEEIYVHFQQERFKIWRRESREARKRDWEKELEWKNKKKTSVIKIKGKEMSGIPLKGCWVTCDRWIGGKMWERRWR